MSGASTEHQPTTQTWRASLDLHFEERGGRTVLSRRKHRGPLVVQRPFYPEGPATCHTYLLHPPGGAAPGDDLQLTAQVHPGAHALLTTPAAGKLYRSDGRLTRVQQEFRSQGTLEWLPQEVIAFRGVDARLRTRIVLESEAANFLGWELTCLGRPAGGQNFTAGFLHQSFEIVRMRNRAQTPGDTESDEHPLLLDTLRVQGGNVDSFQTAGWGLRGATVCGIMAATTPDSRQVAQNLRETLDESSNLRLDPGALFSVTSLEGIVLARYAGNRADLGRGAFESVREILRPMLIRRTAVAPRIWET